MAQPRRLDIGDGHHGLQAYEEKVWWQDVSGHETRGLA